MREDMDMGEAAPCAEVAFNTQRRKTRWADDLTFMQTDRQIRHNWLDGIFLAEVVARGDPQCIDKRRDDIRGEPVQLKYEQHAAYEAEFR